MSITSRILKDDQGKVVPFKQAEKTLLHLINGLQKNSKIIEGHSDPQSYQECWGILREEVLETFTGLGELMHLIQNPDEGMLKSFVEKCKSYPNEPLLNHWEECLKENDIIHTNKDT